MQRTAEMRNTSTSGTVRIEKTICVFLGIVAYAIGCLKKKIVIAAESCARDDESMGNAKKGSRDRDTTVADLCACGVAFAVAIVVYFTMLFFVGEGHANGIAAELLVSGGVFCAIYGIVRFLTTI